MGSPGAHRVTLDFVERQYAGYCRGSHRAAATRVCRVCFAGEKSRNQLHLRVDGCLLWQHAGGGNSGARFSTRWRAHVERTQMIDTNWDSHHLGL